MKLNEILCSVITTCIIGLGVAVLDDSVRYLSWVSFEASSWLGCYVDDHLVMFSPIWHIFSCVPWLHWVFWLFTTRHPLPRQAYNRLIRPGCVCRKRTEWTFDSPRCLLSSHPQSVTALFSDCGEFFEGLPLGLPSGAHFLQKPCGSNGHKAPAAHLHWRHIHTPAPFLCFSCQSGIAQLFPFVCIIDGVFPRDRYLNIEDTAAGVGPHN